jgi:hypothetical protein
MAARHKLWARQKRAWLTKALGGKCVDCGAASNLQFDVATPRGPAHHGMGSIGRMCFYIREARLGNVRLRCGACNTLKGDMNEYEWEAHKEIMRRLLRAELEHQNAQICRRNS